MAIITISRGAFSGGQALARDVAEKLGYRCISREVLIEAARGHGVPVEKLAKALDEVPGIFDRMRLERVHYLAYTQEALVKAVKDERVVYHGLAGQLLLRGVPHVLRVKVIANMESRIVEGMDRLGYSRDQAAEFINNSDKKRDKWIKSSYNVDRNDLSLYDLVINLDRISLPNACEIVCYVASQKEFQATPESQKRLEDFVLGTEVRAMIASDGSIDDGSIEIEAHDGVVTIGGTVESLEDADKIKEIVSKAPGVKEVISKMRVRAHW